MHTHIPVGLGVPLAQFGHSPLEVPTHTAGHRQEIPMSAQENTQTSTILLLRHSILYSPQSEHIHTDTGLHRMSQKGSTQRIRDDQNTVATLITMPLSSQ